MLTGARRRRAVAAYTSARFLAEPSVQAQFAAWRALSGRAAIPCSAEMLAEARRYIEAARVARHSGVRASLLSRAAHFRGKAQRDLRAEAMLSGAAQ
jgi:hypothetical protein